MSFFHQVHKVQLNSQGRFVVPSQFRKDAPVEVLVDNDLWVVPDPDGFLLVRPDKVWKDYIEQIKKSPMNYRDKKKYIRLLHAMVHKTRLDRQNRIALSIQQRLAMGLKENHGNVEIMVVGAEAYFELWTTTRFEAQSPMIDDLAKYRDKFEDSIFDNYSG